jgi:hypothetical protein
MTEFLLSEQHWGRAAFWASPGHSAGLGTAVRAFIAAIETPWHA